MIDTQAIRNKILDLAMRGQLTEQLPEDGSVEELYQQIQNGKADILRDRNGRNDKNIKDVDEDVPYGIPSQWKWIRFGEIGLYKKGPFGSALTKSMFVPKSSDTIKVYEQQHAIRKDSTLGTYYITKQYFDEKMNGFEVKPGDILISCAGTIGETYIMPDGIEHGIINQALMRVTLAPGINKSFFQYYFDANLKGSARSGNGSAIINIPPFDVIKNWYFPLAPFAEQQRIVDKIDQAFSVLDTIDSLQAQYADNLTALKAKLIDAAIQGKLTEQLPEDGTAEELCDRLKNQKKKIEDSGVLKGRKKKKILSLDDVEFPFEIPSSWKWIRLDNVAEIFGRIGFRGYKKSDIVSEGQGALSLSPSNITTEGRCVYDRCTYITWEKYDESPEIMVNEEDVVIVKTGSSYGKCGVIKGLPVKATINPQLALLKYILCNRYYLHIVLNSAMARKQYEDFVVGAATPTFSQEDLANFILPLPPLAEQDRIVAKLDGIVAKMSL